MTQQVPDAEVFAAYIRPGLCGKMAEDLESLRAAVRRVHAAEDAYEKARRQHMADSEIVCWSRDIVDEARAALRAEMASIDGGAS